MDDREIIEISPLDISQGGCGDIIIGVTTTPAMIEAGATKLREMTEAGERDPAVIVDAVYYAMRQAMGEGRPLRRVQHDSR